MRGFLAFLDTIPRKRRWWLSITVGLLLSFALLDIIDMAIGMSSGPYRTLPGLLESSSLAFVASLTRVLFPAVLSPRPLPVGIVMFTLDLLLRAAPVAYVLSFDYMQRKTGDLVTYVAAGAVGGLLGLLLVWLFTGLAAKSQHTIRN